LRNTRRYSCHSHDSAAAWWQLSALDADKGAALYRFNTGGSIAGGVITYAVDRRQYVGAASGKGSFFMSTDKGMPMLVVFTLPRGSSQSSATTEY
jgi:hypothetical protein